MNSMWTRAAAAGLLALVGAITMVGLGGCEDKSAAPPPPPKTTTAPKAAPAGEAPKTADAAPAAAAKKGKVIIGVIAKSSTNPVFIAARTGAEDAARDLSKKYGVEITARW